ncbi:MAG: hypothetical protein ACI35Q_10155 [Marinilabiliaceae bacterium]
MKLMYFVEGEHKHTELVVNTPKTKNSCREIPVSAERLAMVKPLKEVVKQDFYVLTNEKKPTEPCEMMRAAMPHHPLYAPPPLQFSKEKTSCLLHNKNQHATFAPSKEKQSYGRFV